jgi:hypothetical protein
VVSEAGSDAAGTQDSLRKVDGSLTLVSGRFIGALNVGVEWQADFADDRLFVVWDKQRFLDEDRVKRWFGCRQHIGKPPATEAAQNRS